MRNSGFASLLVTVVVFIIGLALLLFLVTLFPVFFWWLAIFLVGVGLIVLALVTIATVTFNADAEKHPEVDLEGPGPALMGVFWMVSVVVVVLSCVALVTMWLCGLAPESFHFLGQGPLDIPRPDKYNSAIAMKWVAIFIFWSGLLWGVGSGINGLIKRKDKP